MLGAFWLPTDAKSVLLAILLFIITYWLTSCTVRLLGAMLLPITVVIFARVSG